MAESSIDKEYISSCLLQISNSFSLSHHKVTWSQLKYIFSKNPVLLIFINFKISSSHQNIPSKKNIILVSWNFDNTFIVKKSICLDSTIDTHVILNQKLNFTIWLTIAMLNSEMTPSSFCCSSSSLMQELSVNCLSELTEHSQVLSHEFQQIEGQQEYHLSWKFHIFNKPLRSTSAIHSSSITISTTG